MEDLISIVVPVYNVEKYVENCVNSLIRQTYQNIEILLINDGSTDNSKVIVNLLSKKDERIKIIHKKNGGLSDARNCGIEESNGQYIVFVDSDDSVEDDFIEYLYNLIKKYNVKISICAYSIITNTGKTIDIGDGYVETKLDKIDALKNMLCEKGYTVSSCAKMYHRSICESVRFPIGKLCEDNGTTYKFIEQCEYIAYGNQSKYFYYKRDNSIMTSKFNIKKMDLLELVDKMCEDLLLKYPILEDYLLKKKIASRFSILRQMLYSNYYKSDEIDEIIEFLKANKTFILTSKLCDKREKVAILCLLVGKTFFKITWNIYVKIKY